ncbi:HNH endonuclease [Hyphomonas sp. L-53-1-40]|uniref:HNH endonuclease n=1 Tax=Hyphomonas sp. L-53-1-40 TaxID=1207058 RepID=UPI0018DD32BB|nr:HNH endonuclease [Hyphomonas sp. L-53-1-40]
MTSERLLATLKSALPSAMFEPSETAPKPVEFTLGDGPKVRLYLWTTTPDASATGRPPDEYKIQIIIPGCGGGSPQHFDLANIPTFVCGFSPLFGIFTFWEVQYHQDCAYSKNLQFKGSMIEAATISGWEIDTRKLHGGAVEVRAAIHPNNLDKFIRTSIEADTAGVVGEDRAKFILLKSPELEQVLTPKPGEVITLEDVERKRVEIQGTRLHRHPKFRKNVLALYGNKCAICGVQLSILDAAHIIPVHHPKGSDDDWNGLALCKNHHALFDSRVMIIDADLVVQTNPDAVSVLAEKNLLGGWDTTLKPFVGKTIQIQPTFAATDKVKLEAFKSALKLNSAFGIAAPD